ncbi:AMP-binding protein [Winogradskyella sp. A3E31]|uniref:AMP-binding protein n=1 Tax=Winogradskyella sp. A3E31 TaxID=3349637 RepID=UPI00398ADD73
MLSANTPLDAFLHWEETAPNHTFLKQPINGKLISYSYSEAGIIARKIAAGLQDYNLPEKSHVALFSKNCAEWIIADLAIMMAGYISIPIYPTLTSDSIHQILTHSESKAIIIGKLDEFENQATGISQIPVISIKGYGNTIGGIWEDIIEEKPKLESIDIRGEDDLHTIIYTSGTTGMPKGVMHTGGSFMYSAGKFAELFKLPNRVTLFSYLPLAHVAERLLCNAGLYLGGTISFFDKLETFASDLEKTQPNLFFAVPRIWTKFREKILESLPDKKLNVLLKIPIVSGMIKKKLKKKLGLSEAVFMASAAAPAAPDLLKWYQKLGIEIFQGYGMTEDGCVSHFNRPGENRIGTVGKPIPGIEAKLSGEGEICIKNECLMKGYFKNPEATAAVFDNSGFLKTGDQGEYDHDGYLTITGRIKDQFKTDKGKYISPSFLELALSANTDIEQICVVGTGIPQPIALIITSELGKAKSKSELIESLTKSIEDLNPKVEKHEKIEKVVIMKEEWSVDNGLLTPSLKVKRNAIEKIHQPFYLQWFAMDDKVIFE